MTVLRLARSELKRMTYGLLPKLTILALAVVPLLYGAVYLYANWDPYKNMDRIPAALVVEDHGAALPDGTRLDAGGEVAETLVDGHLFDWHRVSSSAQADEGVRKGTYSFALTLPADFSTNLSSPSSFDAARQAMLKVTTNDANNYLLTTIVDKVTTAVHDSVAKQVGTETAAKLLSGYGTIHAQLVSASDGADRLAAGLDSLKGGSAQLADGASQLHAGADQLVAGQERLTSGAAQLRDGSAQLASGLDTLRARSATLPSDTRRLADGAAQVAAGNAALNSKVQAAASAADAANAVLPDRVRATVQALVASGSLTQAQADKVVSDLAAAQASSPATDAANQLHTAAGQVQQLATGSQQVADGAAQLAASMPALASAIGQADDGARSLSAGAARLASGEQAALEGTRTLDAGAAKLDTGAAQLRDGAAQADSGSHDLASGLAEGAGKVPNPSQQQTAQLSSVMGDPVAVEHAAQTKAASYGAGLAPFFLSLAMWVGIFMLTQAMRPVTLRALASNAPAWKVALGGWLPFVVVAAAQATLLTAVVDFALGLEPAHPVLMWLFLLLGSAAFSALIHGIIALLGTSGKFVVLVLLILQLVSSGGTFPWQMTPAPFQVAHQILPMGYMVTGMRHLIYGGDLSGILPIVLGLLGYTLLGGLLNLLGTRKSMTWRLKTLQPEIAV